MANEDPMAVSIAAAQGRVTTTIQSRSRNAKWIVVAVICTFTAILFIRAIVNLFTGDFLQSQRNEPLTAEEQASRLLREEQEAELEAARAVAEATARAEIATIEAAAAAEARVVAERAAAEAEMQAAMRVPFIVVPHCDDGWSESVMIPVGWYVQAGWGGRSTKVQYLQDGEWRDAVTLRIEGQVEGFRYCTESTAHAEIGTMELSWKPL